ncbi:hypothetical protein ACIBQX_32000 [Nonomuraea sp. NPDC049714]|uniref:hypothetical protein n=1 Tax=unclassified Nonomuraea TaxID=2593643 RepID=UPI0037A6FA22
MLGKAVRLFQAGMGARNECAFIAVFGGDLTTSPPSSCAYRAGGPGGARRIAAPHRV